MRRRPFWPAVYFRACVLALCAATMTAAGADLKAVPRVHPERWPKLHPPLARDPLLEARVEQLLARLTPAQRVGQLIQADIGSITPDDLRHYPLGSILNGGNSSPRGDKLAAPGEWLTLADRFYQASMSASPAGLPLLWGTDAVHGHNNIPGATIFPHNIGLGAARDPQLVRRIGQITALEVRVTGLDWAFSPTVAVARDARWGRTYESYSENPGLVREYAAAMVEGLQPAGDPAADLVAAGTLGFRAFALTHPALFRIGIQQISVPSDVTRAIAPAAERALPALHRRIARVRDAGRLGGRTIPEAAWEFHAACEGLAALELRCTIRPEDGQRLWHDTLSALVAGWQHVAPGATPTGNAHRHPPARP